MTWYIVKSWKFEYKNNIPELSIVESEKILASEIPDIVRETLSISVVDDLIDDYYGDVEICGNKYPSSFALKLTDEVIYDEMRDEICEMKIEEIIDEMPGKPTTYQAMSEQCRIYWE